MNTQIPLRPGMSLVELLVALTIFSVILVGGTSVLRQETRAFSAGNDRLATVQNYRYALSMIEQDIQTAGTGVAPYQPSLVYAGENVFAFNADYASRNEDDFGAVFYDPGASTAAVTALTKERKATLPGTSFAYPDSSFSMGGANSPAETIIYFFAADASTDRDDDFVLFRQVNDLNPEVLARNLVRIDDRPFFEYTELVMSDTAPDAYEPVPAGDLPLSHGNGFHGVEGDTGSIGRVDWIRGVRVNLEAVSGGPEQQAHSERLSRLIRLPNVRQFGVQTCGDEPLGVDAPDAAVTLNASGDADVEITWDASSDDGAGEGDVVRYLLWRRSGSGSWGDPYLSLPAGNEEYIYVDSDVEPGNSYQYAVSAQDCTPSLSSMSVGSAVYIPST